MAQTLNITFWYVKLLLHKTLEICWNYFSSVI
jgi:hypothetical protein